MLFLLIVLFSEMRLLPAFTFCKKFSVFHHGRVTSPVIIFNNIETIETSPDIDGMVEYDVIENILRPEYESFD